MKRFITQLLLQVSVLMTANASNDPFSGSARSLGMGNTGLTWSDACSPLVNPANMAFQQPLSFALFAQQRYLQEEFGYYAAGLTLPVTNGAFGGVIYYSGFDLYNEQRLGISYARLFARNVAAAIQIDYLATSIDEYGTASSFTVEAGLTARLTEELVAAAYVFNPLAVNAGFTDEKIPVLFRLGLSYDPGEKVTLTAEAEKEIDHDGRFKGGLEYRVVEAIHLRGGFATNPAQYAFGAGINIGSLCIDLASTYHQVLGLSPALSLRYSFQKKK